MPFIGQQPITGAYSKLDAITTSATATYNLLLNGSAYSPASANHLLVSLNGVMQAPQDSFTVSGSTITFASALTSSDSIDFIMVLGDVLNVGTPTDGTVTAGKIATNAVTAGKIASGAVTKSKIGTTELDLATIKDSTGTNTAMTIDSNGTVLMPQKPAWRLGLSPAQSETSVGAHDILFNLTNTENCFVQGNLTYTPATGILDIGVAGVYQINTVVRIDDISGGYLVLRIVINNDLTGASETYSIEGSPSTSYQTLTASDTFKLSVGDDIKITIHSSTDASWSIADNTAFFSGFLVG